MWSSIHSTALQRGAVIILYYPHFLDDDIERPLVKVTQLIRDSCHTPQSFSPNLNLSKLRSVAPYSQTLGFTL